MSRHRWVLVERNGHFVADYHGSLGVDFLIRGEPFLFISTWSNRSGISRLGGSCSHVAWLVGGRIGVSLGGGARRRRSCRRC
jgi:hypothetical protein